MLRPESIKQRYRTDSLYNSYFLEDGWFVYSTPQNTTHHTSSQLRHNHTQSHIVIIWGPFQDDEPLPYFLPPEGGGASSLVATREY
jgi:hypothetical protein